MFRKAAIDDASIDGAGQADEGPQFAAKARVGAEARAEAGHRRLLQGRREERTLLRQRPQVRFARRQLVVAADVEGIGRRGGRRRVRERRPAGPAGRDVQHLLETGSHRPGRDLGILLAHVSVAHQHHGLAAAGPGEDLQAVVVVVVVRALPLRAIAPGPGDVAGGEDILQEVQRERLVGQHGAGERRSLGGGKLRLRGEPARLLQRTEMEVGVDADRVDLRTLAQGQGGVVGQAGRGFRAREQEVGMVRSCARHVLRIGALQADVGGAQRVDALRARGLAGDAALGLADDVPGPAGEFGQGHHRDARQVLLQLGADVRHLQDPGGAASRLEHFAART